jgi:hypothetical protein
MDALWDVSSEEGSLFDIVLELIGLTLKSHSEKSFSERQI